MSRPLVLPALALAAFLPWTIVEGATKDVQKLEKQLAKDKDPSVRAQAAWDLGQMGSVESVPALIAALNDSSDAVRANSAASLWKLGAASQPAIPALKEALHDSSPAVVGNAAGALTKLGIPKAQLLSAYKRVLREPDCEARVIGLKGLVDEVPPTELFDDAWDCSQVQGDFDLRRDASEVLRKLVNRRDRVMVPLILDALRNLGNRDGSDLISALGHQDPPVKEAVPVLVGLLSSRNEKTPHDAVSALGYMGTAALPALPNIIDLLNSKADVDTRESAAEALGRIGPKAAPSAVPVLMKTAAGDKWPKVRRASLTALGEMGPAAREAIPVLRAALKDPDGFIRLEARNALFRVEPGKAEEVAAIADKAAPDQKGSLFEDLSQLASTLPGRIPEAYELIIYEKFAMVTAPHAESRSGRSKFNYQAGTVSGPEEASGSDCNKKIALSKVDFSLVPKLAKQAPGLLGSPSAKVSYVSLTGGVFCNNIGWVVYVEGAGLVEFKLDGKVGKVQKM